TRLPRDWSTDVCSSDLAGVVGGDVQRGECIEQPVTLARLRECEQAPWPDREQERGNCEGERCRMQRERSPAHELDRCSDPEQCEHNDGNEPDQAELREAVLAGTQQQG